MIAELISMGMCVVTLAIGYAAGRSDRKPAERQKQRKRESTSESTEPSHPYRESAAPSPEPEAPKKEKMFSYNNYNDKIWLCCPACGGAVTEFGVCNCKEVSLKDPNDETHFHQTCPHCSLRFAMETREAMFARQRKQKAAKTEEEKKAKSN